MKTTYKALLFQEDYIDYYCLFYIFIYGLFMPLFRQDIEREGSGKGPP